LKKLGVTSLALALTLGLAACGNSEKSSSESSETSSPATKTVSQQEASVKVTDKVFYTWKNESIGDIPQIVAYAALKNTGKTSVDVRNTKLTYLDKDGGILQSTSASQTLIPSIAPSMIAPGETAYLAISEDVGETFKDVEDIEVEVSPEPIDFGLNSLKAENTKVVKTEDWGGDVHVTAYLKNNSDQEAPTVEAAAGLYDKDNKFIGAVLPGTDHQISLQANDKTSVQLGIPSFPSDKVKDVDHAEIQAMAVKFE
jgi:hypothetical protein